MGVIPFVDDRADGSISYLGSLTVGVPKGSV
jgi:hypothetical protein